MNASVITSNSQVINLHELKETLLAMIRAANKYRERLPALAKQLDSEIDDYNAQVSYYMENEPADDRAEKIMHALYARRESLFQRRNQLINQRNYMEQIEMILKSLPDEERTVLEIFGQRRQKGDSIATAEKALHCGKSQVYRLRDRALLHMLEIINSVDCDNCPNPCKIRDKPGTSEACMSGPHLVQ